MTSENPTSAFNLSDILKHAWKNIKGTKGAIWTVTITSLVAVFAVGFLITLLYIFASGDAGEQQIHPFSKILIEFVSYILSAAITAPFIAGALMIGVKKARGETVSVSSGFNYCNRWGKLAITHLIMLSFSFLIQLFTTLLVGLLVPTNNLYQAHTTQYATVGTIVTSIVLIILVLLSLVYWAFAIFSLPCAVDHDKSPWAAFCDSLHLTRPHWVKMVALEILIGILIVITTIPVMMSLIFTINSWGDFFCWLLSILMWIWLIPLIYMILGEAYQRLSNKRA